MLDRDHQHRSRAQICRGKEDAAEKGEEYRKPVTEKEVGKPEACRVEEDYRYLGAGQRSVPMKEEPTEQEFLGKNRESAVDEQEQQPEPGTFQGRVKEFLGCKEGNSDGGEKDEAEEESYQQAPVAVRTERRGRLRQGPRPEYVDQNSERCTSHGCSDNNGGKTRQGEERHDEEEEKELHPSQRGPTSVEGPQSVLLPGAIGRSFSSFRHLLHGAQDYRRGSPQSRATSRSTLTDHSIPLVPAGPEFLSNRTKELVPAIGMNYLFDHDRARSVQPAYFAPSDFGIGRRCVSGAQMSPRWP